MPKSKNKSHHRGKKFNIRARNVWSPFVEQKKKQPSSLTEIIQFAVGNGLDGYDTAVSLTY